MGKGGIMTIQPQRSEVAALIAQIDAEYTAARLGLHGLSSGSARHEVIANHMERAQEASQQLIDTIGEKAALPLIVKALEGTSS